jgi:hypothetical protein
MKAFTASISFSSFAYFSPRIATEAYEEEEEEEDGKDE